MVSIDMLVHCGNILRAFVGEFTISKEFVIILGSKNFPAVIMRIYDITFENNQAEISDLNQNEQKKSISVRM